MTEYRARISQFKARANSAFLGIKRDALRGDTLIVVDPPSLETTDDEKNVLFAKRGSAHWMFQTARIVLDLAREHQIGLRMLALNAEFAGRPPYGHLESPEVVGQAFWEYGSRIKKWVRAREAEILRQSGSNSVDSLLWLGDQLVDATDEFPFLRWIEPIVEDAVETTIGNQLVRTRVRGGIVRL